ncbi:hypothetical protein Tco_0447851 [Tanacetum coccineum]
MTLMLFAEAARYITNTSPLIGALLIVLKKGRDFAALFDKNWLSAANFPLRLYMSLSVFGGSRIPALVSSSTSLHAVVLRSGPNPRFFCLTAQHGSVFREIYRKCRVSSSHRFPKLKSHLLCLSKKPDVYISFITQFWRSAEATTDDNGEVQITATIDGHSMSITEASLRRHLKLDDHDGITSIPNSEIFEQLALMGYHTDSDKLTFQKGAFSPQWRFIQICLDMQRKQLQQHSRTYPVPSLSIKVFNNMKRPTKGYSGQEVDLFPTMLDVSEPSTSPSRITSSPSHSHEPSPSPEPSIEHSPAPSFEHSPDHTTAAPTQPSPTQPSPTQPSTGAEHHFPTPHDSPLHVVHSHGSDEGSLKLNELTNLVTKLSERIGVLEDDLRNTKKTYKVQEKASTETKPIIQEVTLTEVIQDQESSEKGSAKVCTAGATKGTASEVPVVSTVEENISTARRTVTYRRRSEEKRTRKDKGKAIMTESEPKKKSKKEIEQERLSFAEAIRLQVETAIMT